MISSIPSSQVAVQQQAPIITEFFGIFGGDWDKRLRDDTPLTIFNRINIAFGKIIQESNQHFSIAIDGDPERVKQLINRVKKVNPTAEIFLTVGGDGGATSYGGASTDSEFPNNVLKFLQKFGFNGFDIDWEEDIDKDQLNSLTTGLATVLHANGCKLTLDGWSEPDGDSYDMQVLQKNLDQINIMSYGIYDDLGDDVAAYNNLGFPSNQLIGGIETEYNYDGGVDTLGATGTINTKAQYVLANNLAGMMSWRLDNDYATPNPNWPTYQGGLQLWSSMNSQLKPTPKPANDSRKYTCIVV